VRIRKRQGFLARSTDAVVAGMKTVSGWFAKPAAPPTREQLLLLLHQSTSNEQFAKDILQVNVTLPAKSLAAGVVIVDTPGANATNERHAMVTAAALRDLCDAALVVMPATAAGAESLMDFLRAHAGDVLHRCVFLVTKVDLLRRRQDRDWVLDNLRRRLSSGLGIANPRVLAAAPQFVLESLRRNPVTAPAGFASREEEECYTREEIDEWTCHFESMETELSRLLIDKRLQAQADDIGRTLELIFEHLHASLKINLAGYKQRHEALEAIVIPDIADFILGKCNAHVTRAANAVERIVQPLPYQWREMNSAVLRLLHGHIQRATNRPQLTHAMQTTIPAELARAQTVFRRHLELAMRSASEAAMRELQLFHDEFQSHYRSLATLGGRFDAQSVDWQASTGPLAYSSVSTSRDIAAGLQSLQNDRTNKMLGAGAIGALVGTVLLPGLGTVIGGAIGGFLSTMFGPSLDELKIRVWSELEPAVRPHLDEMSETLLGNVAVASEQLLGELREAILSYRPRYDNLVRQMRQRDNEEKVWLSQVQQSIEADLTAIAAQQLEIANVRHKIRQL
jgi:hypothetical protein